MYEVNIWNYDDIFYEREWMLVFLLFLFLFRWEGLVLSFGNFGMVDEYFVLQKIFELEVVLKVVDEMLCFFGCEDNFDEVECK